MRVVIDSYIDGEFKGWDGDQFFHLANGTVWQQSHYRYHYHYAYRPRARIIEDGGCHLLEVAGMPDRVEVRRAPNINFVFSAHGQPVALWHHHYVYTLQGWPVGYISSSHVYRLDGQYVGELNGDMIVDKHLNLGRIGTITVPACLAAPASPPGRAAVSCGYQDVFDRLLN
jgi:hypothetical protein